MVAHTRTADRLREIRLCQAVSLDVESGCHPVDLLHVVDVLESGRSYVPARAELPIDARGQTEPDVARTIAADAVVD